MDYRKFLKSAMIIGIKPDEFWNMTPAEMTICGEVYQEQQESKAEEFKQQFKTAMISAWFNAYWLRGYEMPSFQALTDALDEKTPEVKEMTDEEIFETIKILNAAFGGKVIDTRKGGEIN